jgi:hypothetical protein
LPNVPMEPTRRYPSTSARHLVSGTTDIGVSRPFRSIDRVILSWVLRLATRVWVQLKSGLFNSTYAPRDCSKCYVLTRPSYDGILVKSIYT